MDDVKDCPNCGIELPDIAAICACGYNIDEDESGTPGPGSVRHVATARPAVRAAGAMQPALERKPAERAVAARPARTGSRTDTLPVPRRDPGHGEPRPNRSLLMDCPSCDAVISRRAPRCPRCDAEPFRHCLVCARRIVANAASCPECGDPEPFDPPSE